MPVLLQILLLLLLLLLRLLRLLLRVVQCRFQRIMLKPQCACTVPIEHDDDTSACAYTGLGYESKHYADFVDLCRKAFVAARRHSALLMSLLNLMVR